MPADVLVGFRIVSRVAAMNLACRAVLAAFLVGAIAACSKSDSRPTPPTGASAARHQHHPPHGGTPIVLGNEACHLEFVLDPVAGRLSAYVLDGEMENFIRVAAPSFQIVAQVAGQSQPLVLLAVANPATGETIGDSALFEAAAGNHTQIRERRILKVSCQRHRSVRSDSPHCEAR